MSFVERTLPHVSSHACALWVSFPGTIYTLQLLGESGCSGAPVFDACSSEQADEQADEQAERPADERALQPMDIAEVNVVAEPQTATAPARPFLLIHIAKTGGTSVVETLGTNQIQPGYGRSITQSPASAAACEGVPEVQARGERPNAGPQIASHALAISRPS
jgi:hypothetical protein